MATQGTDKLVVTGVPSIDKLWNGRFRLGFFCKPSNKAEGWYSDNIADWLPEFGTLQSADFTGEGWEALDGEPYPDMRLVDCEVKFIPSIGKSGDNIVTLTYETLTTAWVQEKDDNIDYEANGLRRVSRRSVALPNTTYDSVVGATSMDSSGTTVWLASSKIDETDAKWTLTEVWIEAGLLSTNFSTGADGITSHSQTWLKTVGTTPALPDGAVTGRKVGDYQGLQTITIEKKGFPTDGSFTYQTTVPFTIPGIVTTDKISLGVGVRNLTIIPTPPIPTVASATVVVTYSTESDVDTSGIWQPVEWSSAIVSGLGFSFRPISSVNTFPNYIRDGSGGTITADPNILGDIQCCMGIKVFGGITARIDLDGPTFDPAGTTILLSVSNDPIFIDENEVQYYKKTVVNAQIPARP